MELYCKVKPFSCYWLIGPASPTIDGITLLSCSCTVTTCHSADLYVALVLRHSYDFVLFFPPFIFFQWTCTRHYVCHLFVHLLERQTYEAGTALCTPRRQSLLFNDGLLHVAARWVAWIWSSLFVRISSVCLSVTVSCSFPFIKEHPLSWGPTLRAVNFLIAFKWHPARGSPANPSSVRFLFVHISFLHILRPNWRF